jgi:uncharacterized membrane protein
VTAADLEAMAEAVDRSAPDEDAKPLRRPEGAAPSRVLEVRGVHARPYGIAELKPASVAYDLPKEHRSLYAFDCVVLANFDCSFTSWRQRRMLRDFVADGGRLVVLGGIATLGQGGMKNTYLEDMLPVKLAGSREVVPCRPRARLMIERQGAREAGIVLWRHDLPPRDGAEVLATAGGRPVALRRRFGKGVVCVFTGTTLGDDRARPGAFWRTRGWSELLRHMIKE